MNNLTNHQSIQDQEYSFPYHYIPQKCPNFSIHRYWSWGINYVATMNFLTNELKEDGFNSLVDIGTGDGRLVKDLSQAFPSNKILGIDYSSRAINLAKALNPKLRFKNIDIQKQTISSKFDSATLIEVLEHIPKKEIKVFIAAISNLLTAQGTLYLTVPHKNMPLQKKHSQHFSLPGLRKHLDLYFVIQKVVYIGEQSWQYQLVLLLLANPFFILNHQGLLNLIFSFYEKHLFLSDEESCSRIYLKLVKKETKLPLVSTIITTYNRPSLLPKAIKSALNQTYPKQEVIVINDGVQAVPSSTKTRFPKVKFVNNIKNHGLSTARNLGIKRAKGEYIAFLDDDDQWLPNKLKEQIDLALSHPLSKNAVFYTAQKVTKSNGKTYINHPKIKGQISTQITKKGLSTISSTCLFTKNSLESIGGFDEKLKSNIDHDIWMSLAANGYWASFTDKPLVTNSSHKRQRLIGDYQPRLAAVEQYLKKWQPTINTWFGKRAGKKYSKDYYNYVIGWLAEEQFKAGKLQAGLVCLQKLISKYPLSVKNLLITPLRCLGFISLKYLHIPLT